MNKLTGFLILIALGLALVVGFVFTWNTPTMQDARAAALLEQTRAQVRQVDAQARITEINADTESLAQSAAVLGRQVWYVGLGVGGAMLVIGLTFVSLMAMRHRATLVYPNQAGQMPLLTVKGFGWSAVVDPNRAPGAVTLLSTPTALDMLAEVAGRIRGRGRTLPTPVVSVPLQLSEGGHLQLGAQASAVAMTSAATRHPGSMRSSDVHRAVEAVAARATTVSVAALPQAVTVIDEHDVVGYAQLFDENPATSGLIIDAKN